MIAYGPFNPTDNYSQEHQQFLESHENQGLASSAPSEQGTRKFGSKRRLKEEAPHHPTRQSLSDHSAKRPKTIANEDAGLRKVSEDMVELIIGNTEVEIKARGEQIFSHMKSLTSTLREELVGMSGYNKEEIARDLMSTKPGMSGIVIVKVIGSLRQFPEY
ncbi:hypothetical protein AAE478_010361 [Parahypoxylon ruwenzoriense]